MCGPNHQKKNKRGNSDNMEIYNSIEISTMKHKMDVSPGIYCFICGFNNPINSDQKITFCQNCGAKIQLCPISKLEFNPGDEFGQCTNCATVFHLKHLKSWLLSNQRCPICKSTLSEIATGIVGVNSIKLVES
jgi:hypothetical protein